MGLGRLGRPIHALLVGLVGSSRACPAQL